MASVLNSRLVWLLSMCLTLTTLPTCFSHYIVCQGSNFTANSTYQSNLEQLFSSLTSAAATSGFAIQSIGKPPDQVFGLAFCQGDLSVDKCKSHLLGMVGDLRTECPFGKSATDWDDSFIRYSSANFSSADYDPVIEILYNRGEVDEKDRFENLVTGLMEGPDGLIDRAAYASDKMFAADKTNYTTFLNIYGSVQCTRDQTGSNCSQCLKSSLSEMKKCCYGHQGGVVLRHNCYLRFEVYSYYNETSVEALALAVPPSTAPVAAPLTYSSTRPSEKKGDRIRIVLIAILVPCAFLLLALAFVCVLNRKKFTRLCGLMQNVGDEEKQNYKTLLFDLQTLKVATDDFSSLNKLGEGGFGAVYKGVLPDGMIIAVKRLSKGSTQGFLELRNEVVLISKVEHKNLVRLLGCCSEKEEKLLVYEFVPNSSLDKLLYADASDELNWDMRQKIIVGIAKGLQYLHEDCGLRIIHRDLKPSNILLHAELNPKISDFGLAKLMNLDKTQGSASRIVGTNGYIAPEYAFACRFSTKSDVYSYGVLVLEILTGRRASDFHGSGDFPNLPSYAWNYWKEGKALEMVDQRLRQEYRREEALRCFHIALLCVQKNPTQRPSMASIVLMLNSESVTVPSPSEPCFFVRETEFYKTLVSIEDGDGSSAQQNSYGRINDITSNHVSINDVTTSELEAR